MKQQLIYEKIQDKQYSHNSSGAITMINKMRACVLTVFAGFLAISLYADPKSVEIEKAKHAEMPAG